MQQGEKLQLQSSFLLRFVQVLNSYRVLLMDQEVVEQLHIKKKVNRPISALQIVVGNRTAGNAVFLLGIALCQKRLVRTLGRKLRAR